VSVTPSDWQRMSLTCGPDGRFDVRGLPAGAAILDFHAAGFLPETRTVDTPRSPLNVVLSRGLALEGVVVRDGAGVRGASVRVFDPRSASPSAQASTDEQGRFRITGLGRGPYRALASDRDDSVAAEDVDLEHASPLRLVLGEPAMLTVNLVGLSHDDDQEIRVRATQPGGRSFSERVHGTYSVRFDRLPPGRLEVAARAETPSGARFSRQVELRLRAGEAAELTLEFPAGVTASGRVTRGGQPVPGARVSFTRDNGDGVAVTADGRGSFEAAGLVPGPYTVRAGADGGPFVPSEHVVAAGAQLDLDITTAGVIARVVRADTGAPLVASVAIDRVGDSTRDAYSHSQRVTDEGGLFASSELAPGRYRLTASKPGFAPVEHEVELLRGKKVEVVVELRAAPGR
jgi:hypothetical protein